MIHRITTKNPKFFDKIQLVSLFVGSASAVVVYLKSQGIELPGWLSVLDNTNVVVNSIIAMILAQLPNDK